MLFAALLLPGRKQQLAIMRVSVTRPSTDDGWRANDWPGYSCELPILCAIAGHHRRIQIEGETYDDEVPEHPLAQQINSLREWLPLEIDGYWKILVK